MADYGDVTGVASLSPIYTSSGVFDGDTRPTSTEVEAWLDQVSSALNLYLATEGFEVPVTEVTVLGALDGVANSYTVDLLKASHSAGRFFTEERLIGKNPFTIISKELQEWVKSQAAGFKAMGATRLTSDARRIGSLQTDQAGDAVAPLFQLGDFGNVKPIKPS